MNRSRLRRPDTAAWIVVAAAWAVLIAASVIPAAGRSPTLSVTDIVARGWPMWVLMATAMMTPAAVPAARHVAENSFRWRRHRAVLTFLGAYLAVWAGVGLLAVIALAGWSRAEAPPTYQLILIVALALALVWQLGSWKKRRLAKCRASTPLAPYGWKAFRSCIRFGARHGVSCVSNCWPLMLVMTVTVTGRLWWMLGLTGVVLAERWVGLVRANPRIVAGPGIAALTFVVLAGGPDPSAQALTWICTLPLS
jgi:predicted metal-binding membrane protein